VALAAFRHTTGWSDSGSAGGPARFGQTGGMTVRHILGSKLALVFVGLVLLSAAAPRVRAEYSTPQAISAVDVATSWVYALKRGDARVLDRTSVYPFELHIQKAPCSCKDGKARDAAQLTLLLGELMKSEDVKGLEVTSSDAKEVAKTSLPKWAKRWSARLPKGARLVHLETAGGLAQTLTFVLVVTGNQVRAVWLNTGKDPDA
jgi:hypothetical protein